MAIAPPIPAATPRTTLAATPGRDTGIDLVRALCVIGVVTIHALMVGVTVADGGPVFANASEGAGWITPLSWVLQVMPLFFVIAGFAGYTSRSRMAGRTGRVFAAARIHRLLLPAVYAIAAASVGLTLLLLYGVPEEFVTIAGYRYGQPLWFLGVFLLCQVLLPALAAAHDRAPWLSLALLAGGAIVVDATRIVTGDEAVGFLNLAFVWLTLQQVGFFLADGRIDALTRRTRMRVAIAAVAVLVADVIAGIHSADLIANINPPTTALLLVGIAHTMLMSLLRERLIVWSRTPLGTRIRNFVTARTMTIYLWHMPVLLAMAGLCALFSMTTGLALPEPSSLQWWLTRPLWLAIAFLLTAAVAWALAGVEARRAPQATRSATRLVLAVTVGITSVAGVLIVGATPLTAGLSALLLLAALHLARGRAVEAHGRAVEARGRAVERDRKSAAQTGSAP